MKRKKDTRREEPTTFILYLRVNVFPFKTEENDEFITVGTVDRFRLKNWPQHRSKIFCNFALALLLFFSQKKDHTTQIKSLSQKKRDERDRVLSKEFISSLHA